MKKILLEISIIVFVSVSASAQVFDGQQINATVTNNAFWKRNVNDIAVGVYSLQSSAVGQGSFVNSIQTSINACDSFVGVPANSAFNVLPTWGNNDVGTSLDNVKTRADALTAKFNDTAGHKHTGAPGDAPQLPFSSLSPTTPWSTIISDAFGALGAVPNGPSGYFFMSTGPSSLPTWVVGPSGGSGGSGGGGGVIEFKIWGNITQNVTDFGEPHYWGQSATLSFVNMTAYNCGASGSLTIAVKQWRSGAVIDTATASLGATGGLCGSQIALSHSQAILSGDVTTVDLTAFPTGSPNALTVSIDSGALAGPAGPTGASGAGASPMINGTASAPVLITAVGGIPFSGSNYFNKTYISGNGGPVTVTATPQIASCSIDGQELTLVGKSNTNTVTIVDDPSNGVSLNGTWVATDGEELLLDCDSNFVWVEKSRSN